jgi:NADH:ubiquinone reductase (H+-translocating)
MTTEQMPPTKPHRVVIVGAGFGGLEATFRLAGAPVCITLLDRRNHHLFQPLLYQVATASLATSEIAWPIRYLLRGRPEVTTLFATVNGVDTAARRVLLDDGDALPYDTLVLATGAFHAYFGHDEWEPFAPGLKTLEDATTLRRRILVAFERAERETDPERRAALLTFVIVGAGPTGVELAGTIAELAQDTLPPDFRNIDTHRARVVLIEAGPRVLAGFPDDLSAYAQRALESLGVEVVLGKAVTECSADGVMYGGETLQSKTLIWAAGVRASPAAEWLGAPADRAGRLQVAPDLTVPGHPDRRYRYDRRPGWQAGARHCTRRKTAGALCRGGDKGAAAWRNAGAVPLPACRQPGADRQAQGGDRLRTPKAARHHRMVDLGHRPHLFSDRPAQPASSRDQLAVDSCPRPARRAVDHAGLKQGGRRDTDNRPCLQNWQTRLSGFAGVLSSAPREVGQAFDNMCLF